MMKRKGVNGISIDTTITHFLNYVYTKIVYDVDFLPVRC